MLKQLQHYLILCKPRVVALMLLTALVGMLLAVPYPQFLWAKMLIACVGIGFAAGGAAVINHVLEHQVDSVMRRTQKRPVATGQIKPIPALLFSAVLTTLSMLSLTLWTNTLTAVLTFATLIGYAVIYTVILKPLTSQNIVIGGLAGAAPPLLGWTAMTGQVSAEALLLVLIIFVWTPPHFWALAIYRKQDYAKIGMPMLPVTHGDRFTKVHILLYTLLLMVVTTLPFLIGMSGWLYWLGSLLLGGRFLYWAIKLYRQQAASIAWDTFRYSIIYLGALFGLLLVDHFV